jgi:hypothetical protein
MVKITVFHTVATSSNLVKIKMDSLKFYSFITLLPFYLYALSFVKGVSIFLGEGVK